MQLDKPARNGKNAYTMHTNSHTEAHIGVGQAPASQAPAAAKLKHEYPKTKINPSRGIRLLPIRPGAPSPYGVLWSAEGKRRSQYFRTIELLEAKISELNDARRKGDIATMPTRQEVQAWRSFKVASGGVDPMEILVGWRAWREASGRPICTMTVATAVDDFMDKQEKRLKRGAIGADTFRQKRRKLTLLKESFASQVLDDVTSEEIEEWLDSVEEKNPKTEEMERVINSVETFRDYLRKISELFNAYSDICPKNPCDDVEIPGEDKNKQRPDLVMPVDHVRQLLSYAKTKRPKLLVRLAAELFVGLRTKSAGQLKREHFKLDQKGLDLPSSIMKTKDGHYIDKMPPVFWKWVRLGWDYEWDKMSQIDWMHAKSALFEDADVPLPHNGCRHTFCSFHVSAFDQPGLTATILCHRNQVQLWKTYKGKASEKNGVAYFKLNPKAV